MRETWIVLAIGLSMAAGPALARHEPPSREEPSSGGMESNDPGEPSAPAESAPSSGSDRQDSNDASSSPDVSPPSSDRDPDRYSREAPDVGREHRGKGPDSDARPHRESGDHGDSTLAADGEATGSTPPGAHLRNPDSPPPADAQRRHPRPHERGPAGGPPDSDLASDYGSNDGSLNASYGYSTFDYGGRYGYAPDYFRNRSRRGGSLRLLVEPWQTRVYVDGYYAGIADDFKGTVQRLFLPPGRHLITLELDGYRSQWFQVEVSVDHVIDVRRAMEPLEFR